MVSSGASTDSSSITLKVMHCKDLKAFNFFQKLLVYVLVSIASDDPAKPLKQKQQQRTPADKEGDGNPEWNHEMQLDLSEVPLEDSDHLFIHFDLRHEGLYFGDKTIGEVRVPLKDVIEDINGIVRFVSYEVRNPEGKPNGVLNFSYKVNRRGNDTWPTSSAPDMTGFPVVHHQHQPSDIQNPVSEVQSSSLGIHHRSLDLDSNLQPEEPCTPNLPYPHQGDYYPPPPDMTGFPVVHHQHQPSDIQNPVLEVQSSSLGIHHRSLDLDSNLQPEEPYTPNLPYPHQGDYYPPPPTTYYPRPPPTPPSLSGPPPAALMVPGACYHPPHPPAFSHWRPHAYNHRDHGNWRPTFGEAWQTDFRVRGHPSFWNSR